MGAEVAARRPLTARQTAERLGVSVRLVQKMVAEPRPDYVARANQRRAEIVQLHRLGLKQVEIALRLNVSKATVSTRLKEARLAGEDLSRFPGTPPIIVDGDGVIFSGSPLPVAPPG